MWFDELKRTLPFLLLASTIGGLLFCFYPAPVRAQSSNAIADLAARINRERTSRGMIPYALNAQLSAAAQAHADDISRTGIDSHTGSDGSTVRDRVARAGYGAYSWGRRVGENWAWYRDAATAMQMWMGSPPHTRNILHSVYREFGIGISPRKDGGFTYVVDFGAQPNVLPIFIQNDGRDVSPGRVTLVLSNENYAASGDGANTIGQATQVEISSSPDFAGSQWQTYAPRFAWTLPGGGGTKTVYVKFRDARGRTTASSDSVNASAPVTVAPTAKPSATNTPRPRSTAIQAIAPTLTPILEPSETPSPTWVAAVEPSASPDAQTLAPHPFGSAGVAQIETPAPLPPDSAESRDPLEENQLSPIALGVFGVSVMLGVLSIVIYFERRLSK